MGQRVTARIKAKGKWYEIDVDLDEALKVKAGKSEAAAAMITPHIFLDLKKGNKAAEKDLIDGFGTKDAYEIGKKIMTSGEIQKTQEFRDAEKEQREKRVIDIILRNAVDQNGRPYTEERIKRAIQEAHAAIDNRPAEQQLNDIVAKIALVITIKIETKKIKLIIPARFSGQSYGILKDFKESEEWLANGDLQTIIAIPAGMQIDFFDKLNNIAHGAIRSEEIVEKKAEEKKK
jgi:ribosome maturation protein SDO1